MFIIIIIISCYYFFFLRVLYVSVMGFHKGVLPTPSLTVQQPQKQSPRSFVFQASANRVTFFSLELVEELLTHTRKVDEECGFENIFLLHSSDSARVLSRIALEARYEEYWSAEHFAPASRGSSTPSALSLLRIGILRALGFQTPGLDEEADDASIILGRDVVRSASLTDDSKSGHFYYREAAQEELRHVTLGEWCEELICFAASRGFSAEQVRCVLLTAMHLMNAVAELPVDASDACVEERCGHVLKDLFIEQACSLPNKVFETRKVKRTVVRDVPDPQLVASIEAKMARTKNKKQLRALQEQMANVPSISETRVEPREEKVLTEIRVGPYFTLQEVAHILDFFSLSVIHHWRLFRTFLSELQPVETTCEERVHWDIWGFCIPPLCEFLRDDVYAMEQERQGIINACVTAIETSFDEEFLQPLSELRRMRDELLEQKIERERLAEENNLKNALKGPDCVCVARVFALRLGKQIEKNDALDKAAGGTCFSTEESSAAPTAAVVKGPQVSSQVFLGDLKRSSAKGTRRTQCKEQGGLDAVSVPESSQALSPIKDTVFSLEAVRARLERLEIALQAAVDSWEEKKRI